MASDFADIINDYRVRCEHLLQNAQPHTAEQYAYSEMLRHFEQFSAFPPNEGVLQIRSSLTELSSLLSVHPNLNAPPEAYVMAKAARAIVREWVMNFIRDTGKQPRNYGL